MKKIVEFSVKFPVTVVMVVFGILLLGYISFDKLGIDLFPDLNNPRIYIEVTAGERPPAEMERQFVENIEALAIRQSGVTDVSSKSRVGNAIISVEYAWDKDMDEAYLDLQRAMNNFAQNEDIEEINISRFDPNAQPVMTVGLTHNQIDDMNELRKVAENYIRNELVRLEGVADVMITGDEQAEVVIETNPYLLKSFGLTPDDISVQINNFNRNVSGGSIEEMSKKYVIKGVSIFHGLEDLENLVVAYRSPQTANSTQQAIPNSQQVPVFLRDVASIRFENADPANITTLNGERCLGLSIYKETRYNTVKAVEELEKVLADISKALPGYHLQIVQNQGSFISDAIWEVEESALLGIAFAVLILFVFLRRIGSTMIISVAIPISIVATFNLMYFNDLTLNIMTLGGLALGAGMLVDNAIVVLENIYKLRDEGMSFREAAIEGTSQVGGAITASTITTIVVFLPIVYLQGASGELFKDQAWTVAFSLLSSLFVAILVIPMLVGTLLKSKETKKVSAVKMTWYSNVLTHILKFRFVIVLFGVLLVGLATIMLKYVGNEYMPNAETSSFTVELNLPEGTRLERTNQAIYGIEQIIRSVTKPGEVILYGTAGPSETDETQAALQGENSATLKVILTDSASFSVNSLIRILSETVKSSDDLKLIIKRDETALQSIMGTEDAPVKIEISGKDFEIMEKIALQVQDIMERDSSLFNVRSSIEEGMPEVEVVVDRLKASMNNVNVESISSQISDRLQGADAGQLDHEGELKDIKIKLPKVSTSELEDITIRSGSQEFALSELANISINKSPKEILRRNQNRIVTVDADFDENLAFDKAIAGLSSKLNSIELPSDYSIKVVGEEQKRLESMESLTFAMVLSILLVYMVLASQFESLIHPFTILLTIPLAGVGAIMIFFFAGISLNIMAYIGIIMLVGIAVNDSIILVDAINQNKVGGMERGEAIINAGQNRIRPILMTSLTTILALLPLTFGFGESASLRQPMALAVIGGLVTSTLLTLVVIPCVYYYFDQFKDWLMSFTKTTE